MTTESVLEIIENIDLTECKELVKDKYYLSIDDDAKRNKQPGEDFLIILYNGKIAGGIYRMADYDLHAVMVPEYRDKGIFSELCKSGIIKKIWEENKAVELCAETWSEFYSKKYLTQILGLTIKNENEIIDDLSFYRYLDNDRKIAEELYYKKISNIKKRKSK